MKSNKKAWIIGFIVALIIFIRSFGQVLHWIAEYQWFQNLAFEDVFLREFITKALIFLPVFIGFILIYSLYIIFLKKNYYKNFVIFDNGYKEKRVNQVLSIPVIFLSFTVALNTAGNLWFEILVFLNRIPYGVEDPIFQRDISFYLFQLPMYHQSLNSVFGIIVALLFLTVFFYIIMFILRKPTLYEAREDLHLKSNFMAKFLKLTVKQLTVVGILVMILVAIRFYLSAFGILNSSEGLIYGAGYTDVHVRLPLMRIQMVLSLIGGVLIYLGYRKENWKIAALAPGLIITAGIIGGIAAALVQQFSVTPNELSREFQYIEHNIEFTQRAYGIHEIERRTFDATNNLTIEDIENNPGTIDNIRINDHRPTLQTFNQIQAIRLYYRFLDVDIDRYIIDGEYTQVFIAPRELDLSRLGEAAQESWINRHLRYTHGNGVALSPVNRITSEGQPDVILGNIPPRGDTDLVIDRPQIYFGELTDHYIIVNTEEEFAIDESPGIDEEDLDNFEGIYRGTAGIDLSLPNRFLYALKYRSMKILLNDEIREGTKIVYDRNIKDRLEKIAPFIHYDEDPYMVINDGKLYWIVDGYTESSRYPYSTPYLTNRTNYKRNSVKVVVDAYNGDVSYYISDHQDPIIKAYQNIYPELIHSMDAMDEGLRTHIRYPHTIFDLQTEVYRTYHMTDPRVFYDQGDLWNLAEERYRGNVQPVESHYMILRLPEEEEEEFILSRIYTPKDLRNMTAMLVARNDGEHYGDLVLYDFPRDRNIYGPMQIENRIDQRADISERLSLWDQGGSEVIRGNIMVIPVEDSILYVEPIYLAAEGGQSLPEVKKVIVAYGDQVVMMPTLKEALDVIFGDETVDEVIEDPGEEEPDEVIDEEDPEEGENGDFEDPDLDDLDLEGLIRLANEAFEAAHEALRDGDWTTYGEYMDQLEEILRMMDGR